MLIDRSKAFGSVIGVSVPILLTSPSVIFIFSGVSGVLALSSVCLFVLSTAFSATQTTFHGAFDSLHSANSPLKQELFIVCGLLSKGLCQGKWPPACSCST